MIANTFAEKKITQATEIDIVRMLLQNEKFVATYAEHIKSSLFMEYLRPIVESSLKYWQQYRKLIPQDALIQSMTSNLGVGFTEDKLTAAVNALEKTNALPQAPEFSEDIVVNFIRFQRLENAMIEGMKLIQTAEKEKNPSKLVEVLEVVSKASEEIDLTPPSFMLAGLDERTDRRTRIAIGEEVITAFPTGIKGLDELLLPGNGLKPKQVGIFVGATGRGKSIALAHCAMSTAFRGHPVAYFSLELPEDMLLDRMDASVTETYINKIVEERNNIRERIMERQATENVAEIVFRAIPFSGPTTHTIRNELKKLKYIYGFDPDLVVIDYADLMQPTRRVKEGGWKEQQIVTEDLHIMATDLNKAIWTASQGNRGAAKKNEEGELLTDSDTAESYNKLFSADVVATINRTKAQMAMPEPKAAWLNLVKNRTGPTGRVGILTEFSKMQFYVGAYEETETDKNLDSPAYKKKLS